MDYPNNWVDVNGANCATYKANNYCTVTGSPGAGWEQYAGSDTFADLAVSGIDIQG